ncbi:transposase [Streptomyces sp. NPDC051109]|uniref:transposase n=1 Tax=Streptomyces sp. NPDC051109 TaxID=3365642 RepID=UPI003795FECF
MRSADGQQVSAGLSPARPSDLSDEAWELIRPVTVSWEIVNAILNQARTGCQWRYLPHGLPPKSAVHYHFALWRDDGSAEAIHDPLRRQVREMRRRHEDPTAVVLDSQSVRASTNAP